MNNENFMDRCKCKTLSEQISKNIADNIMREALEDVINQSNNIYVYLNCLMNALTDNGIDINKYIGISEFNEVQASMKEAGLLITSEDNL